ncbi:MAG TPA: lipoate--protein ligase family protein [Ktedonobacterales bacterium]
MMTELSSADFPPATWRLIVETDPHDGAWNMAVDETLMEAVAAGASPPVLRCYQWAPPCLSLGKRQPIGTVDLAACQVDGVHIVRRATGGGAILHTDELTYSVAIAPDDPRAAAPMLDAYRRISQGLVAALASLGLTAEMNPFVAGGPQVSSAACFEAPSAYEITVSGMKLIGSAQARPAGRVLQHGSIPLHGDIGRIARYLAYESPEEREALAAHLRERATTLDAVAGREVTFVECAGAVGVGFTSALRLALAPSALNADEMQAALVRAAGKRAEVEADLASIA